MLPEYNKLLQAYTRFCNIRKEHEGKDAIDFSDVSFMYPTTLLPLATLIQGKNKGFIPSDDANFTRYLLLIMGGYPPGARKNKTYMSIEVLPEKQDSLANLIDRIETICKRGEQLGGRTAFNYMITELMQNIYDHSECENAYFMVQRYPKKGFVEISIIDDGKTIRGSYKEANIETSDAIDALQKALNGYSTKEQKERGFGLGTTVRLVSEGLKAQIFVVSGEGAFLVDTDQSYFFKLATHQQLPGTLITMRIPYPSKKVPEEKFYEYVEG